MVQPDEDLWLCVNLFCIIKGHYLVLLTSLRDTTLFGGHKAIAKGKHTDRQPKSCAWLAAKIGFFPPNNLCTAGLLLQASKEEKRKRRKRSNKKCNNRATITTAIYAPWLTERERGPSLNFPAPRRDFCYCCILLLLLPTAAVCLGERERERERTKNSDWASERERDRDKNSSSVPSTSSIGARQN